MGSKIGENKCCVCLGPERVWLRGGVLGVLVHPMKLFWCGLWSYGGILVWFGRGLGGFKEVLGGLACFWVVWGVSMDRDPYYSSVTLCYY